MSAAPYVAVCGPAAATDEEREAAEAVGAGLARSGAVIVCGGGRGVAEAACRGAQEAGGITIGLLPGEDRGEANPFVSLALPTGIGELRNGLIVRAADVVVAIGGAGTTPSFGTLSEIAIALRVGTPVVGVATWELGSGHVTAVASAAAAVRLALELAAES